MYRRESARHQSCAAMQSLSMQSLLMYLYYASCNGLLSGEYFGGILYFFFNGLILFEVSLSLVVH